MKKNGQESPVERSNLDAALTAESEDRASMIAALEAGKPEVPGPQIPEDLLDDLMEKYGTPEDASPAPTPAEKVPRESFWSRWFRLPTLGYAGGALAAACLLFLVLQPPTEPSDGSTEPQYRGATPDIADVGEAGPPRLLWQGGDSQFAEERQRLVDEGFEVLLSADVRDGGRWIVVDLESGAMTLFSKGEVLPVDADEYQLHLDVNLDPEDRLEQWTEQIRSLGEAFAPLVE